MPDPRSPCSGSTDATPKGLNGTHPSHTLEIAFYFAYYGRIARETGLAFVAEAVAHDIGRLVRRAWEAGTPNRQQLLDRFLDFDADAQPPLVGAKKAHAILASYFLLVGLPRAGRAHPGETRLACRRTSSGGCGGSFPA